MSQTASSQPRRQRGGRNRNNHHRGGRSHDRNHNSDAETFKRSRRAPQFTFLEKLLAVFGLGPKAKFEASRKKSPQSDRPTNTVAPSSRTTDLRSNAAGAPPRSERQDTRPPREPRPPKEPRPVVQHEITSGRLYVGNLSYDVSETDLTTLFSGVGQVQSAEIVVNRNTQRSKGFAFVEMLTVDEAKRAVSELHDKEFMGRKMLVTGAKPDSGPKEPREAKETSYASSEGEEQRPARREREHAAAPTNQPRPDVTTGIIRRETLESVKTDASV